MRNHGSRNRVSGGGGAKSRFLVAALAALAVLSAFLVFPREAGAQSPVSPTLTVSGITVTSATLTISNHDTAWWYRSSDNSIQCAGGNTNNTKTVTGLQSSTDYSVAAFSDVGCLVRIAPYVDFTTLTPDLTVSDIEGTSAKLTWNAGGAWWYKGGFSKISSEITTQCTSVATGTADVSLTGLLRGTSYWYYAYSASGCAAADRIDTVNFQTTVPTQKAPKVNIRSSYGGPNAGEITLKWDKPSSEWNRKGAYTLAYKKSSENNYTNTVTVDFNAVQYTLKKLDQNTKYDMLIKYSVVPDDNSLNTVAGSQIAYALGVTSKGTPPGSVTNLEVEASPAKRLSASWDAVSGASSYNVKLSEGGYDRDAWQMSSASWQIGYDLTVGKTYTVAVRARKVDVNGPWSSRTAIPLYAAPGKVGGVSVTAGVQRLAVSWNAVSGATGYEVQWKSGTEDWSTGRRNTVSSGSTTTSDITGLTGGTVYTVRVTAVKTDSMDATPSDTKTGTPKAPAPGKVTGVSVDAPSREASNLGKLEVDWDTVTGATGFHVQWKSGAQGWSTGRQRTINTGSTTADTITGLANDTTYTVRVRATKTHADNGAWSEESTGTTNPGPPGKVGTPTVTPGIGTLSVSWSSVSDVTGYKVQWKSGNQNWSSDRENDETGTTSTISNLTSGTTYVVRVIAYNADGDAVPSQTKTGVPKYARPAQVTGVTVTEEAEQLAVSWSSVSGAENYVVQWKSGTQGWDEDNRQKTESGTSSTITGLVAGTEHTVRVKATRRHADDGEWSDTKTGTPMDPQPNQVTGVSAQSASGISGGSWVAKLKVSWNSVSSASGYLVQWKSGNQNFGSSREHTVSGGNILTYTIGTGLTAGTEYTVRVKAKRTNAADGPWSPTATGTPKDQPPGSVTGLTLTPGTEQLVATWDAVSGASGYKVRWRSGAQQYDDPQRQHEITGAANTTYTIRGLRAGVEHTVQVMATKEHADDGPPSEAKGRPNSPAATAAPAPGSDAGPAPPDSPDDARCPDYPVGETAGGVERDRDPDTLAEFVQDALFGVKSILSDETEEGEAITRLVDCFGVAGGVAGGWMSGSVYLFAITDSRKYFLAPKESGLDGTHLNLTDENGCDVAAELIRAAKGEDLQCKDLGLLPDGDAAGFVQYLWDNPSDPSDDSEPGYEERGEAPGNSPKLSYVEMITNEDILPGGFIVLVSGYFPDWDPGEEPAPPTGGPAPTDGDGGGGCAVASEKNALGSAALGLFLTVSVLLVVSLRNRLAEKQERRGTLCSRRRS